MTEAHVRAALLVEPWRAVLAALKTAEPTRDPEYALGALHREANT